MYQRKNIRSYSHDYGGSAWCFETIKTHQNEWLFGKVIDGIMQLNKVGEIVQNELIFYEILPQQHVWQRNFNDRIIRDKKELIIKQCYIHNNPFKWKKEKMAQIT